MGAIPLQETTRDLERYEVEEEAEALLSEAENGEEGAQRESGGSSGFWRAAIWTTCSATALYSTKVLMVSHRYHYPNTIAFRALASIFLIYITFFRWTSAALTTPGAERPRWGFRKPEGKQFLLNSKWAYMIPASVAAAVSFPMLLQGILHMPSLPVLVMLFPLIYATESLVLVICCSSSRSQRGFPWEILFIAPVMGLVLLNEYRLMVHGLIWGVVGILLMGVSRALFTVGSERVGPDIAVEARLNAYHGFVIMAMTFGMLISGALAFSKEHIESIYPVSQQTIALLAVNMVAFIGTAFSGSTVLAYSPLSFEEPKPVFTNIPIQLPEFLISSGASILVFLVAIRTSPVPYVSWVQIILYIAAAISLVGVNRIHEYTVQGVDNTQITITKSFRMEPLEKRKPSRILTTGMLTVLALFYSIVLYFLASNSINSLPLGLPSSFDVVYKPQSEFDIVVSMYDEDPSSVKSMLTKIKSTTYLSTLQPRIIIYTKNPTADLSLLKTETGADIVERLENLGREGGTYLWHMVNKWDELAQQTMFIQAHAHNFREITHRIDNYLVAETGMLSLGFTGVSCNCYTCGDRWGWEDRFEVIPALYEKIYSTPCIESTNIFLSYKGQFIASARRIRGIDKKVYGGLLKTITSKEGWSHSKNLIGESAAGVAGTDTPDNPYFGFTMERIWGLVLQCGVDERVGARCESLLSGTVGGSRTNVGDCQCLDPLGGS